MMGFLLSIGQTSEVRYARSEKGYSGALAKPDQDKLPHVVNASESQAEPIIAMMFVPAFRFVFSALGKVPLLGFLRIKINSIILRSD